MAKTLHVLDAIEGTDQPGEANYYNRERVVVYLDTGESLLASTYIFARTELIPNFRYLPPSLQVADGKYAIWPAGSRW